MSPTEGVHPENSTMSLHDLLDIYCVEKAASPNYRMSLTRTVRRAHNAGITDTCQLTLPTVAKFLATVAVGQTTKANYRRELATLWRYAHQLGLANDQYLRLPRISPQYAPPEAWSMAAMRRLLDAADADQTRIGGRSDLQVRDVLPVWARLGYESGLRFTDIHQLTIRHFRDNCVVRYAAKTQKLCVRPLTEETQAGIANLFARSPDDTLFKWAVTRRRAFGLWRKFLDTNRLGGSSKWLRRTAATYIEVDQPGMATRWLDHSSERLARNHYVDPTKIVIKVRPPRLPR